MLPKKILLAEDDKDDCDFFIQFLRDRTDLLLFSIAENGEEVLDLLSNKQSDGLPDLILLDQNMPKRNGLQTLRSLKENNTFENIPVFIYSTYADGTLKNSSMDAGAISVFTKPYTPEGYHKMIDDMLGMIN